MTMAVFEIPFVPGQPQQMQISLNGTVYSIKARWCDPANCWMMDLSDSSGNPILLGVPLVTGADLLDQYEYLGIGGALIVQTDNDVDAVPTFANHGSQAGLYFVTPST